MVARGLGTRQASFGDEGDEHGTAAGAGELVRLKRASAVLQDLGLHERLDVLHVNCEGCALAAEGPALWDFGWGSAYPRRGAPGGPLRGLLCMHDNTGANTRSSTRWPTACTRFSTSRSPRTYCQAALSRTTPSTASSGPCPCTVRERWRMRLFRCLGSRFAIL